MRYAWKAMLLCACLLLGVSLAYGQTPGPNTGHTSFGASEDHDTDSINLATLVPTINFPVISKTGAFPFGLSLISPQSCFIISTASSPAISCGGPTNETEAFPNMSINSSLNMKPVYYLGGTGTCANKIFEVTGLTDADGAYHATPVTPVAASPCGSGATVTTTDGSYISAVINTAGNVTSVTMPSGYTANFAGSNPIYAQDPFSNQVSSSSAGTLTTFTDTLANSTVTVTLASTGQANHPPTSFGYTDSNGSARSITLTTGAGVTLSPYGSGTCNTGHPNPTVTPVTSISYPDGTSYGITWDQGSGGSGHTSGLVASVTLRTGGTISYSYTFAGVGNCTAPTWTYSALSRTTPDGLTTYSYSGGVTTVLDPGKNKTLYTFALANPGCSGIYCVSEPILAQVQKYQNTNTVGSPVYALISTETICYNNVLTNCTTATPTFPITQRDTYEYAGANSNQMSHRIELFDSYGNVTSDAFTDNTGSGQTKTVAYVYGTYSGTYPNGNCVALGNASIRDHVCTATTTVGGTQIAQTTNVYNANGALTSSIQWLSSTSQLTTSYSPNNNGTIASVTAPNGQVTTNTYGNCNNLLLTDSTTTVNSVAIDNKQTWDCNSALVVDTTDPNGNEDDTTYDSIFRVTSYTDRNEQMTTFSYGSTVDNYFTSTDPLGVIRYRWTDGLGRTTLSQIKQSPSSSNYDTVSSVYQWNGTNFQTQVTVPCVQTYGNGCPATFELTTLTNSAAGPTSYTDANNGTATYGLGFSSSGQDTSVTVGPAPSGEHTKVVQTERDGFGRIKSVCPLETSGGTSCGQALGNSGILTSASYSFATGSSTATTTRGSQTHTTVSDALGRVTSAMTPEAGTVTSYYDTIPNPQCYQSGVNESGFLTATKDNAGNYICPETDGIGRVYAVGSGSYCKRFVYDSTASWSNPPSGYPSSGNNLIGRLVRAETDNCSAWPPTPITDEWFAYDKDGRMTDMWESTPNSSGYYHTTVAYDADGTPTSMTLAGQCSPTFAYGVDGEDRPNSMSLCGNTTIVNSTGFQYDAASRPLTVPIGTNSGDQDTYTYDGVGNMTEYTFTVNGTSYDGKLTWNPIGSLQKLVITDGFNSGGSQTCTFGTASVMGYDDVGRLLDDNCGSSLWHQSYSYDQYDNLTKTGNPGTSWNPGYASCPTPCNNEMIGSSYDSNGNLTYDGVNSYSWDLYGQMVGTISGNQTVSCGASGSSCTTHDAFGRIVESSIGSSYQEMLYSPIGLLGYMNGQSVNTWYLPAPGGGDFFMTGGVMYFEHPDNLGTKRLGTTLAGRAYYMDQAFAPYGDIYDAFSTHWTYNDFTGITNEWFSGVYTTPNRQFTVNSSRWPSPEFSGSWNGYSYVTDPNTQTDRSGLGGDQGGPGIKPAACCNWLQWLGRFLWGNARPDDPPSLVKANVGLGAVGELAWRYMMSGNFSGQPEHQNPWCSWACAAAASKRPKDQWSKIWQYRRDIHKGFWGDHWLEYLQNVVGDSASPARLKNAANGAIEKFLAGKKPIEMLVRDDSVLRGAIDELIENHDSVRAYEFEADMKFWDVLEGHDKDVMKYKVGTWFNQNNVDKIGFLPNGERATAGKLIQYLGLKDADWIRNPD